MSDLQEIKPLAEQIFGLAAELLRVVDMDETARRQFIEDLKKTPAGRFYIFPGQRRTKTGKKAQAYISLKRRLKHCRKILEKNL